MLMNEMTVGRSGEGEEIQVEGTLESRGPRRRGSSSRNCQFEVRSSSVVALFAHGSLRADSHGIIAEV